MIPAHCITQHDPEKGRWGDCYRACLASILELPADQVPNFIQDRAGGPEWRDDERTWLASRGLEPITLSLKLPLPQILEYLGKSNPGVHYILGGTGANGMLHAVVASGPSIVHDPGGQGITGPTAEGCHVLTFIGHRSAPYARADRVAVVDVSPLDRHERIGLYFSGGKDSLALVHLLRPHWDQIVLYHVDAGDLLPETREIVAAVEAMVPRFCRIETDSKAWRAANGWPSDIVPWSCTGLGRTFGAGQGGGRALVDRFQCCHANLWEPMHQRARQDGITLDIMGTKASDPGMGAMRQATGLEPGTCSVVRDGVERWFPIQGWSDDYVFSYLRSVGAPIARYYEGGNAQGPECATCSAWWDEGRAAYLSKYHPTLAASYLADLQAIGAELRAPFLSLVAELAAGGVVPATPTIPND